MRHVVPEGVRPDGHEEHTSTEQSTQAQRLRVQMLNDVTAYTVTRLIPLFLLSTKLGMLIHNLLAIDRLSRPSVRPNRRPNPLPQ